MMRRRFYPSDVTDRQWALVANRIPPPRRTGRIRTVDLREVVNAISYRTYTGCTWRDLPEDLPAWQTVYEYFRHWERDGTLAGIRDAMSRTIPA